MGQQHSVVRLAKFLAYVLGRRPDDFGLVPDGEGFVKVKDLLKVMHEEEGWGYVHQGALHEVVMSLPDPPVEIVDTRIRAVGRELLPRPGAPNSLPKLLYTAVRSKAHPVVVENGILPLGGLPYVILSSDRAMAHRMGRRIDVSPVLLTVNVAWAAQFGVQIQQFGEKLYLAESIPVGAFSAPPLPKEDSEPKPKKKGAEENARAKTPGSFMLDLADIEEKASVRRERKKREISRERERRHQRKQKKGQFE